MNIKYDKQTDTLTIVLRDARIKDSDEIRPGLVVDYGYDGKVVQFELLQASQAVDKTQEMQYAVS